MANRLRMTVPLDPLTAPAPPLAGARRVDPAGDREALAQLMLDAYLGTVDDEGETEAGALAAIDQLFAGEFGPYDAEASEVVDRDGRPVAATLLTAWDGGPFVAFSMTHPAWQRQGLARGGLLRAMGHLAARGETRLDLVVTAANAPAVALYGSLGFAERA
jgi:ribosomal protein S18 acetylase RimI-like enzyme